MLAQNASGDPDTWLDTEQWLPLLTPRKWHTQTHFGYARGREPVHYGQNICNCYNTLACFINHEARRPAGGYPSGRVAFGLVTAATRTASIIGGGQIVRLAAL